MQAICRLPFRQADSTVWTDPRGNRSVYCDQAKLPQKRDTRVANVMYVFHSSHPGFICCTNRIVHYCHHHGCQSAIAEDRDHLLNTFPNGWFRSRVALVLSWLKTDSAEKHAVRVRGSTPFRIEKTAETKYFINRGGNDSFWGIFSMREYRSHFS